MAAIKLRPEVLRFAKRMERKLRKRHARWGNAWKDLSDRACMAGIRRETRELAKAIRKAYSLQQCGTFKEMQIEAVDVANWCMFMSERKR